MRYASVCAIIFSLFSVVSTQACELKLLLSWDVSASMSEEEFQIQRIGTAQALRHPQVKNAVALSRGGVAVALIQWAGPSEQVVSLPWTMLRNGREVEAFGNMLEAVERAFPTHKGTAVGNSLKQASVYLEQGPTGCIRTVLDISGDGVSNTGIDTATEADALERTNITINGLVLPGKIDHLANDPYMFYVRNVARGPSSFVMEVNSYSDFPRAMRRKFLRELMQELAFAQ